ncbi:MAG: hypothetical protein ABI780_12135, partial [Ardenticatenales bacterium]
HALSVQGDRLYAGIGDQLRTYDITDPANPTAIGPDVPLGHALEALFFDPRRALAYAALGGKGIAVLDLADPDRPRIAGARDTAGDTRWLAVDVEAVDRTRLWLADRKGGLVGLDVTDPAAITPLGVWPAQDQVRDVVLDGALAYALDRRHGLHIVDISDVMQPREVGYYDRDGDCDRLFKDGDIVWVKVSGGWWKVDVSDPAQPTLMTDTTAIADTRPPPSVLTALAREARRGDVVFDRRRFGDDSLATRVDGPLLATGPRWLVMGDVRIDVTDPRRPTLGPPIAWPTAIPAWGDIGLAVTEGPTGYYAAGPLVDIVDIGQLPVVTALGRMDWSSGPSHVALDWAIEAMAVGGGKIVVAGESFGGWPIMAVGDVAEATQPVARGINQERLPANIVALAVAADGQTAFGIDAGRSGDVIESDVGGLTAFDIRDPDRPRVAGYVAFGGEGRAIVLRGTTAFVAANKAGALIVDVADSAAPRVVGPVGGADAGNPDRAGGSAQALALDGSLLAVAFSGRLELYSIADPRRPRFIAAGGVPGGASAVAITPGWVWVMTGESGLLGYALPGYDP